VEFPITCITGKNGSGKTNMLDAVYNLCYTKSYFSSTVQPTIMHGTEGYRIEGSFNHYHKKETVVCKYKNNKKEISCGGVVYERQSDHIGKYAAVMVAPDDIEMINDGSELRRKFIDGILSQCDKTYLESLLQYQKVLIQRNAWLKMYNSNPGIDGALLDYYNNLLSQNGTYIFDARTKFLNEFIPLLQQYYQHFSDGKEEVNIDYQSDLKKSSLSIWLNEHLQHDIRYQRTLRGIHKDDFLFLMDGNALKNYGSQGQKKSFLFSLKLAQFEYLKKKMGSSPILLLDDVFEKLDQQRMEALLKIISNPIFGQVILTDTHENRVSAAFGNEKAIGFIRL
jgi:DNA replication and repair protein RecF